MARILRLEPAEVDRMMAVARHLDVPSEKILFSSGQPAREVFLVVDGTLRVFKALSDGRRIIVAFAEPGDFLGLGPEGRYSYDVEAVTRASVCRFPRARLDALLDQCPQLRNHLLHAATGELQRAQDRMMLLGRKTAPERLASFLLQYAERAERAGERADRLYLPMGRGDIADYLGLTTETVSRVFSQMKLDGLIDLPNSRRVALRDRAALLRASGGVLLPPD